MIVNTILSALAVVSVVAAYYWGLRRGRADGVDRHYRQLKEIEARARAMRRLHDPSPPSVRSARIKPTSRERSQVDLDDGNG